MKNIFLPLATCFLFLAFLLFPFSAFAFNGGKSTLGTVMEKATEGQFIPDFFKMPEVEAGATPDEKVSIVFRTFVNFILYIIGIAAVIMIVYSGARFVFSTGSEEQITKAKQALLYAVLGLVAVILALTVVNAVVSILYRKL